MYINTKRNNATAMFFSKGTPKSFGTVIHETLTKFAKSISKDVEIMLVGKINVVPTLLVIREKKKISIFFYSCDTVFVCVTHVMYIWAIYKIVW